MVFLDNWRSLTLDKLPNVKPLVQDETLLLFDIDGTLYWEFQQPSEDTAMFVDRMDVNEIESRWPWGRPEGWYIQQKANLTNYIAGLTGLSKPEAMDLQASCFEKHNQTLRGLINEGIVEDCEAARHRYWAAVHFGAGIDGSGVHTSFHNWVKEDSCVTTWVRSLPKKYRKVAFTNASEPVALLRLEQIGFNPESDFDLVVGSEFLGTHPKPCKEAWLKLFEPFGITSLTNGTNEKNEQIDGALKNGDHRKPLSSASAASSGLSHPVVMFEDSLKNIKACKDIGIGVVRVRNPRRPESYTCQHPTEELEGPGTECMADVVVNSVSQLDVI